MDVKRGPILFRCDGTPDLGWEPLYQCLALAAALQRRRRGTHFLSYLEPLSLAQVIHRGNNEWAPADVLEDRCRSAAEAAGMKAGDFFSPLRVAVTGRTVSPPLFASMELLGRARTLARLDHALAKLAEVPV